MKTSVWATSSPPNTGRKSDLSRPFRLAPAGRTSEGNTAQGASGKRATNAATAGADTLGAGAHSDPMPPSLPTPKPKSKMVTPTPSQGPQSPVRPAPSRNSVPTPINVDRFKKLLEGYDEGEAQYLVEGLRTGFRLEFDKGSTFQDNSLPPPNPQPRVRTASCRRNI